MSRPTSAIANAVGIRARSIDAFVSKMDALHRARSISDTDLSRVYASGFLEFYVSLEQSLEDLFLGLAVSRLASGRPGIRPLVSIASDRVAKAVIVGERYADWLPYDRHTTPRANAFFSGGRPFSDLPRPDIRTLNSLTTLRNALAHGSAHALRQFDRQFVDGKALPRREQRPSGYLRGLHAVGQTRLNLLMSEGTRIMDALCR